MLRKPRRSTGHPVRTEAEARDAARRLLDLGPRAVIVKGGHLETPDVVDLLFDGRDFHEARGPRHATRHTHGTGCTFAAAIAAHLALGHPLPEAFRRSRAYLDGAIRHAPGLGHGRGPGGPFLERDARVDLKVDAYSASAETSSARGSAAPRSRDARRSSAPPRSVAVDLPATGPRFPIPVPDSRFPTASLAKRGRVVY